MYKQTAGFGVSKRLETSSSRTFSLIGGSESFMAPEVICPTDRGHSFPVDMWGAGIVMYALFCNALPFEGSTMKDKVCAGSYKIPKVPSTREDSAIWDAIAALIAVDEDVRISQEKVALLDFFSE